MRRWVDVVWRVMPLILIAGCARPLAVASEDLSSGHGGDLAGVDLHGVDLSSSSGDLAVGPVTCNTGYHQCGAVCILDGACCLAADCPVYANSTASCMQGNCMYTCNAGFQSCNGTCRSGTQCCADSDCTAQPHTTGTKCDAMGQCTFSACATGYLDLNMVLTDGCECQNTGAQTCAAATDVGSIALGSMHTVTNSVPSATGSNWFTMTFAGTGAANYYPHIRLTANPGSQFLFDVVGNCSQAPQACGSETGKNANGVTDWEVSKTGGVVGGTTYTAVPAVGTAGNVKLRVFRAPGAVTCDAYTVTISN